MLSGGKDSVLMLHDLWTTHPSLRVLCVTYDDGLLGAHAKRNVDTASSHFGHDSLILRHDCRPFLDAYLSSDLPRTVDVYTFLEVFQNLFWGKIQALARDLGGVPVVTGNLGYFSSEILLPDQHEKTVKFLLDTGFEIIPVDVDFISYWAEEPFPEDFSVLEDLGWESGAALDTDNSQVKALRAQLNAQYPKVTLDDRVREEWNTVTRPRFSRIPQPPPPGSISNPQG